ncbi:MAG TPA: helix-turn-helix transcriptional regulator [Myxococcota bacterium]|nr:helix-turn-helix transcriptional regulator [Myxococcota bacterium]
MDTEDDPVEVRREGLLLTEAFGRAVKVIRTGLDLGRRELAERAGLSYSYVAEIEGGRKAASRSAQYAIARALGMSASELLAAAEEWAARIREAPRAAEASFADVDAHLSESSKAEEGGALGARVRQLRWFKDSAATRVWDRSDLRPAGSLLRSSKPADERLVACLAELRRLLERMPAEDRERVLDLARRLAKP